MNGEIAGRVAAWLSRLDWSGWPERPSVSVRVGDAHAYLVIEWSDGDLSTRAAAPLLLEEPERMWCSTLRHALILAQAPWPVALDGRPLVAEPTLVPWGEA